VEEDNHQAGRNRDHLEGEKQDADPLEAVAVPALVIEEYPRHQRENARNDREVDAGPQRNAVGDLLLERRPLGCFHDSVQRLNQASRPDRCQSAPTGPHQRRGHQALAAHERKKEEYAADEGARQEGGPLACQKGRRQASRLNPVHGRCHHKENQPDGHCPHAQQAAGLLVLELPRCAEPSPDPLAGLRRSLQGGRALVLVLDREHLPATRALPFTPDVLLGRFELLLAEGTLEQDYRHLAAPVQQRCRRPP
jgi:hypothetical protein